MQLHFQYESIENLVRLLITIKFEKTKSDRDINVFHQRFDEESDDIFGKFLTDVYPEGCTIGEDEINHLTEYVYNFMQKDEQTRDLYVIYNKHTMRSYVYFKPDKTVHYTPFGEHAQLVTQICCNYFKNFDKVDMDYLQKFILKNFEIRSDNTTIEKISRDANYIVNEIIMEKKYLT